MSDQNLGKPVCAKDRTTLLFLSEIISYGFDGGRGLPQAQILALGDIWRTATATVALEGKIFQVSSTTGAFWFGRDEDRWRCLPPKQKEPVQLSEMSSEFIDSLVRQCQKIEEFMK